METLDAPDNNAVLSSDVSTDFASNGTKSMRVRFQQSGRYKATTNCCLLGNKATGHYSLKWKMYVPAGKNAYYNLQNTEAPTGAQIDQQLDHGHPFQCQWKGQV